MKRRYLANSADGKIIPYAIDDDLGVMPCHNLDIGYMFHNQKTIKTGFHTYEEAQKWLLTSNRKNQK